MLAWKDQFYQADSPDITYGFRKCCEAVREAVPIEEVARRYTDLDPLGGRAWFSGRCPLPDHEDRTPSFYLYPPRRYYCFGCGRGGDAVDLEFFCGDYGELWEAMIALSREYGVALPRRPESWYRKQEHQRPIRAAIEGNRREIMLRRLFKWLILPMVDAIQDEDERQQELERAWADFRDVLLYG
jgi:hypothetical protein